MDVSKISLHRSKLMALCIFSIMICHNTLQFGGTMQSINDVVRTFMQGGVDGFLILSGLGCYYSYNRIRNIRKYYIRRITRIMPTYIFIIACYAVFSIIIIKDKTVTQYLYDYSLVTFWTDGVLKEWYIASLIVLYIVSPLMFILIDKNKTIYKILIVAIMVLSVLLGMLNLSDNLETVNEIFGSRISAFMIGILLATSADSKVEKTDLKKNFVKNIFGFILLCIAWFGVYNLDIPCRLILLRFLLQALYLILLSILSVIMDCSQKQYKVLSSIGTITLEIYLLHEKITGITYFICCKFIQNTLIRTIADNIMAIVISIVCAYIVSYIIQKIKYINKPVKKEA